MSCLESHNYGTELLRPGTQVAEAHGMRAESPHLRLSILLGNRGEWGSWSQALRMNPPATKHASPRMDG